jgi:RNA polymerase sigma factor (sigma-70 family)
MSKQDQYNRFLKENNRIDKLFYKAAILARNGKLEDAEDILQTALAEFWEKDYLNKKEKPFAYLFTMVSSAASEFYREGKYEKETEVVPLERKHESLEFDPFAGNSSSSWYQKVKKLVATFSPEDQQLFQMRSEGSKYINIAAELGIHPDTVKRRLTRMKCYIREKIGRLSSMVLEFFNEYFDFAHAFFF